MRGVVAAGEDGSRVKRGSRGRSGSSYPRSPSKRHNNKLHHCQELAVFIDNLRNPIEVQDQKRATDAQVGGGKCKIRLFTFSAPENGIHSR